MLLISEEYRRLTGSGRSIVEQLAMPEGGEIEFERPRAGGPVLMFLLDTEVAQRCARLHVPDPRAERDAIIAATVLVHGMAVVTRNPRDFEPTGVQLLDPWDVS